MELYIYFSVPVKKRWWLLSNFIRWSEWDKTKGFFGRYHSSHVAINVGVWVWESLIFMGVQKIHCSKWLKANTVIKVYRVEVPPDKIDDILSFMDGSVGVPYAYLSAVGIFIQRVMKTVFKKEIANPFQSITRKRKCTEFAAEVLQKLDFDFYEPINSIGVRRLEEILDGYVREGETVTN
jgi:hypothetical protein